MAYWKILALPTHSSAIRRPEQGSLQFSRAYMAQPKGRATILVTGPSTSANTAFANLASGSTLNVGEFRAQSTQEFDVDGCAVNLISTPGFRRGDPESLKPLKAFINHRRGESTTGIICLHSVDDENHPGDIRVFSDIFAEAFDNSAFVTTNWDAELTENRRTQKRRERELVAGPLAKAIKKGARVFRHDREKESAVDIVRYLIQKPPILLRARVRREPSEGNLRLQHTGGGQILLRDLSGGVKMTAEDEQLELLRRPRGEGDGLTRADDAAHRSKIRMRRYKSGDMQGLARRTSRIKLRRVNTGEGMYKPTRLVGLANSWELGEVFAFMCCGLALYALMVAMAQFR